jgi:tetratricopeptide (TPR) repeat protein
MRGAAPMSAIIQRILLSFVLLLPLLQPQTAFADPKDPIPYAWSEPLKPGRAAQLAEAYVKLANSQPTSMEAREKAAILLLAAWKFEASSLKNRLDVSKLMIKIGKEMIKLEPKKASGHFWYGAGILMLGLTRGVLNSLQLVPEAKQAIEKSIALDPNYLYSAGKFQLCRLYTLLPSFPLSLGDMNLALELSKEAQKNSPNFAMGPLYLADLYWAAGNQTLALRELEKLDTMKPTNEYEYLVHEVAKMKADELRGFFKAGKERDRYYDWIWMEMQPGLVD